MMHSQKSSFATAKPQGLRDVVIWCLVAGVVVLVAVGVVLELDSARRLTLRKLALARLCDMRLVLEVYEEQHGTLPPLCVRDNSGTPIHSWRALVLPGLRVVDPSAPLDLSQPWNSDDNRMIIDSVPPRKWRRFARDEPQSEAPVYTHILAYRGGDSIWDTNGLPRGKTTEFPDAVLLVSIPKGSIHPLQPGDITEDEVRNLVRNGHEVFFIKAGWARHADIVTIEGENLVFQTPK